MNRFLQSLLLVFFAAGLVQAQPFLTTKAFMYDQGPDPYFQPEGCKKIEIWRFVPGARFEKEIDLRIETREYDEAGRCLKWSRYNTITGGLEWEKTIAYNDAELRMEERLRVIPEGFDLKLNYKHEFDSTGLPKRSLAVSDKGELFAVLNYGKEGKLFYTEHPNSTTIMRQFVYLPDGRTEANYEARGDQRFLYAYDEKGHLKGIARESAEGKSAKVYNNTYDEQGLLVVQEEVAGASKKTRFFEYDEEGRLIVKYNEQMQSMELRHYNYDGTLRNMLIFRSPGYAIESIHYDYTYFKKTEE